MQHKNYYVRGLGFCMLLATSVSLAATITGVSVEPQRPVVGQLVRITVTGEMEENDFCGLWVEYGPMGHDNRKMGGGKHFKFPLVLERTFTQPGNITVIARGGKTANAWPCGGKASVPITIVAGGPGIPVGSTQCPAGSRPIPYPRKKAGTFACRALTPSLQQQTPKPIQCAPGTQYFDNRSSFGCR